MLRLAGWLASGYTGRLAGSHWQAGRQARWQSGRPKSRISRIQSFLAARPGVAGNGSAGGSGGSRLRRVFSFIFKGNGIFNPPPRGPPDAIFRVPSPYTKSKDLEI